MSTEVIKITEEEIIVVEKNLSIITGAELFTALEDTPDSYVGQEGKIVKVNSTADGLEFVDNTEGVTTFIELSDVPNSYLGNGGKILAVKVGEDGLEFADVVVPTKTSDLTNDSNFISDSNYIHTDNNFTNILKTKLDNIEDGANNYVLPTDVVQDSDYIHTDNNYTNLEKTKLGNIQDGAEVNVNADWNSTSGDSKILNKPEFQAPLGFTPEDTSNKSQDVETDKDSITKFPSIKAIYDWCIDKLSFKVDKVTGKGLSTEDYTNEEKIKLSGIEANANNYSLPSDVVRDSSYVHTDNNYTTTEKNIVANSVQKTGAETIAGVKTFSNNIITGGQFVASTSNLILSSGSFNIIAGLSTVGLGLRNAYNIAKAHIHQDWGNATATYHKFTCGTTTGQTVNDGFDIGISSAGVAQLIQRENLNVEVFTNAVKVGDISSTGVWANNSGTWSTLSDERLKENIEPVTDALEKCLMLSKCVRHYNFKNQVKYATGIRTGYIAQLLRDNGFEGHVTYNLPVDEEEGVLLGWEYNNEIYFEDETKFRVVTNEEENESQEEYIEEVEKVRRVVTKEGEMVLGIENNFVPYIFGAIEQLNDRLRVLEEKLYI